MKSSTTEPMPLSTERLVIRRYGLDDRQDYFEIFSNPNIAKYDEFEPIDYLTATKDIQEILEWYRTDHNEQSYTVELVSEKKSIGCLYHKIEENGELYIGYHFNENYHGKGYAQEAVSAYVFWLLEQTPYQICAACDPENKSSIRLLEKVGFSFYEKRLIESEHHGPAYELVYKFFRVKLT